MILQGYAPTSLITICGLNSYYADEQATRMQIWCYMSQSSDLVLELSIEKPDSIVSDATYSNLQKYITKMKPHEKLKFISSQNTQNNPKKRKSRSSFFHTAKKRACCSRREQVENLFPQSIDRIFHFSCHTQSIFQPTPTNKMFFAYQNDTKRTFFPSTATATAAAVSS